jgi:catalase
VPFVTQQDPPPGGLATTTYFGVDAVAFINASGKTTILRYRLTPDAGEK